MKKDAPEYRALDALANDAKNVLNVGGVGAFAHATRMPRFTSVAGAAEAPASEKSAPDATGVATAEGQLRGWVLADAC
jgi:hypothetical protein